MSSSSLRAASAALRSLSPGSRAVWLSLLVSAAAAAGCGDDGGNPSGAGAGSGGAGPTSGSGGAMGGSVPNTGGTGSGTGGSSMAGVGGGSTAGSGGSAAGTGGDGGSGGASAGSGGSGGSGGAPPVAKMCEKATGNVPTFKRVAASDGKINGAVGVVGNPEHPDIIYVPEHFTGDVRVVQGGKLQDDELLHVDVRQAPPGDEQGLLGITLHPDFTTNHLMYVYYSAVSPVGESNIEEFKLDTPTKATFVRKVYQEAHSHQWHNGGNIQFGSDKWLYVSIGDNQNDCGPNCSQANEGPYGRIRKLDVSAQNPESTVTTFQKGLRNPWRWSFDPLTFDVVIGDVGNGGGESEKLFFSSAATAQGRNWGWAEGTLDNRDPDGTISTLASDGGAIIGGVVYRGSNPKMAGACGRIFFGHLKGQVYSIKNDGSDRVQSNPLSDIERLGSFGTDANGEIYVTYLTGQVFRIDAQ